MTTALSNINGDKNTTGLFSNLENSTIKNLNIENCSVESEIICTSLFAGLAVNTKFINVSLKNCAVDSPQSYYAALLAGGSSGCTFTDCTAENCKIVSRDKAGLFFLDESGSSQAFGDVAADSEMNRNLITIVQVFAYGFVVIISLICVANVFNTISTNIGLRRREFAMLKSVGITQKGFNKMMNLECLLYGAKALCLGLPVSILVTYLIYYVIAQLYGTEFYLPLKAIAIAIISVFVVVFVTMMYAMRKIKNDNPIDALKNEN